MPRKDDKIIIYEKRGQIALFFLAMLNHIREDLSECIDLTGTIADKKDPKINMLLHSPLLTICLPVIKGIALIGMSGVNIFLNYQKDRTQNIKPWHKKYRNTLISLGTSSVYISLFTATVLCSTLISSALLSGGLVYGLVLTAMAFSTAIDLIERRDRNKKISSLKSDLHSIELDLMKLNIDINHINERLSHQPNDEALQTIKRQLLERSNKKLKKLRMTEVEIHELSEMNKLQLRYFFTGILSLVAVVLSIVVLVASLATPVTAALTIASGILLLTATTIEIPKLLKEHRTRKSLKQRKEDIEQYFVFEDSSHAKTESAQLKVDPVDIPQDAISLNAHIHSLIDEIDRNENIAAQYETHINKRMLQINHIIKQLQEVPTDVTDKHLHSRLQVLDRYFIRLNNHFESFVANTNHHENIEDFDKFSKRFDKLYHALRKLHDKVSSHENTLSPELHFFKPAHGLKEDGPRYDLHPKDSQPH